MERLRHVRDTAHAVAAYRALETDRPDGVIHDPFAKMLAGQKGMKIAESDPAVEWMSFGVSVRDRFVDELLARALTRSGIETVVNLGAGLDARPWRLELPATLRWIEVDFKEMLQYKTELLRSEHPRCILERVAADISLPSERERIFQVVGDGPALMVTEGLLMYLPKRALESLGSEAAVKSGVRWWILDVASRQLMHYLRRFQGDVSEDVETLRAKDHLQGQEIIDLVVGQGWVKLDFRSYIREAPKLTREGLLKLAGATMPRLERFEEDDPSGVYLFSRMAAS